LYLPNQLAVSLHPQDVTGLYSTCHPHFDYDWKCAK
jgi:hypothetical protein